MADYVLGNLSLEDVAAINQLLEANPDLIADVTALQEVLNLMPQALPRQEPPPHLRSAILDAAQQGYRQPPLRGRSRHPIPLWAGTIAALVVLTLVSVDNYRLRQELQETEAIATILKQPGTLVRSLTGIENTASGTLVIDPEQQQILITVHNLPQPPAGKTYRLWAIAPQGTITYVGQFVSNPQEPTLTEFTSPPLPPNLNTFQLRITLESTSAPLEPQGTAVMQSL